MNDNFRACSEVTWRLCPDNMRPESRRVCFYKAINDPIPVSPGPPQGSPLQSSTHVPMAGGYPPGILGTSVAKDRRVFTKRRRPRGDEIKTYTIPLGSEGLCTSERPNHVSESYRNSTGYGELLTHVVDFHITYKGVNFSSAIEARIPHHGPLPGKHRAVRNVEVADYTEIKASFTCLDDHFPWQSAAFAEEHLHRWNKFKKDR